MRGCASNVRLWKRKPKLAGDNRRQPVFSFLILVSVLLVDQLSKFWAVRYLNEGVVRPILGQFLQFKLVFNKGGALGTNLGSDAFYLISSLLILSFVIYFIVTHRNNNLVAFPLAAIAGGAVGNILDRIRLGEVIDFIDLDFFDFSLFGNRIERWWTFNVADAAITAGVIMLLFYIIFLAKAKKSAEAESGEP
jgi:signal peptidase II